jgi:hypothetical protein
MKDDHAHLIDLVCDRFEEAWRKATSLDQRPRIEEYVTEPPEGVQPSMLLYRLLVVERELGYGVGERPTREEYLNRFPEHAETISAAFQSKLGDGWLVILAYFLVFSWSRWVSFGGLTLFYRRQETSTGFQIKGRTWLQDCMHLAGTTASVTVFSQLDSASPRWFLAIALSVASFRIIDLLFDFFMLAVFGNRYGRPWAGAMAPRRLHRTLIIDLLLLIELVFWNACWVFVAAKIRPALYHEPITTPGHALHMSVATVTTIGYGTYAPVENLSVLIAFLQAISAVLLLSGVIGSVFSRTSSISAGPSNPQSQEPFSEDSYGLPVIWDKGVGWYLRGVLPIILPAVLVGSGTWWLLGTGWLESP